ncbi:DUF6683 family protein [Devosia sp. A449]
MIGSHNLIGALLGAALLATPVQAQDFGMVLFNDSIDLTNAYIAQEAMASVANAGAHAVTTKARTAAEVLQFGTDRGISAQVREQFRSELINTHPSQAAAIDAALRQDWLRGYREEIATPNGLDPANLADAYTGYLVASWALVNNVETLSDRAIASVRNSMRMAMAENTAIAMMSDAEKQHVAESLIYNTVLVMANRIHISQMGDMSLQRAAADHYQAAFLALGIDLSKMALSDTGFVSGAR